MKVAMVKHKPYDKVFWFEIPEHLVGKLQPGFRVACNTARGRRYGTVVAADLDEQDVKEVMFSGELRRFDDFSYLLRLIERTSDVKFVIDKKVVQVMR